MAAASANTDTTATTGTAQGSTKSINSPLTHQPLRMKKPDSSSPKNSFRFTPNTRNTSVLTSRPHQIGRSDAFLHPGG